MKKMHKALLLVACLLLGVLALVGEWPGQTETKAPTRERLAGERPAPLLLDASMKVAGKPALSAHKVEARRSA